MGVRLRIEDNFLSKLWVKIHRPAWPFSSHHQLRMKCVPAYTHRAKGLLNGHVRVWFSHSWDEGLSSMLDFSYTSPDPLVELLINVIHVYVFTLHPLCMLCTTCTWCRQDETPGSRMNFILHSVLINSMHVRSVSWARELWSCVSSTECLVH